MVNRRGGSSWCEPPRGRVDSPLRSKPLLDPDTGKAFSRFERAVYEALG